MKNSSFQYKALITTNPLDHEGGVVSIYNLFFKHFKSDTFELRHFRVGSRAYLFYYPVLKRVLYPFYFVFDIFIYIITLLFDRKIKIIQVNPSLIPVPLIRDGILILIGKLFSKNIIVFYHGWKTGTLSRLKKNKALRYFFNRIFQKGTQQIVLASSFKNDLLDLGHSKHEIQVFTTAIDRNEIIINQNPENTLLKVLFLGRIQDLKGVEEIIDAIIQLNNQNELKNFQFTFIGHEDKPGYINALKAKLSDNNVSPHEVSFPGRITGKEKFKQYALHDVFLLPSYTEGCPVSVLEALASGLFCITTDVGALKDLIIPEKNGLFVHKQSAIDIANALKKCNNNRLYFTNRIDNAKLYSERFDIKRTIADFNKLYLKLNES